MAAYSPSDSATFAKRRDEPGAPARAPSMMSATALRIPLGVIPCALLNAICFFRRRFVSSIARCIEPVTVSA